MSVHEGHRQRVKERFLAEGLDGYNEINALEMLLFYAVPRVDTNPLAHRLIDHFGSLHKVMEASPVELQSVEGVGPNVASFLGMFLPYFRYYKRSKNEQIKVLKDTETCGLYLSPYFFSLPDELALLVCLDAKRKPLCVKKLGEGSIDSVSISSRKVIEIVTQYRAASVVMAHNHPGGLPVPSQEDYVTTQTVQRALDTIGVELIDHIIFCDESFVSMKQIQEGKGKVYSTEIFPMI